MIAGTPTLGNGFRGLQLYLFFGRGREEPEHRVQWWVTRNLYTSNTRNFPNEMRAVAFMNPRVEKPVYHFSLNAAPGEELTQEDWEKVADRVLANLGLSEHQTLIVAHGDTGHRHIHLMVNRVHPGTHRAWKTYRDWPKIEEALRHLEREMGLREVPGQLYRLPEQERPDRSQSVTSGEVREQMRTGEEPWAIRLRFRLHKDFAEARSWPDLEHRLAKEGVRFEARERGLVVTDGERQVKASRLHREGSKRSLEARFGVTYEAWRGKVEVLSQAIEEIRAQEEKDRDLSRRLFDLNQQDLDDDGAPDQFLKLRQEVDDLRRRLGSQLDRLYGSHAQEARTRLERTLDEQGFTGTAEVLQKDPAKLAPLPGRHPFDFDRKAALQLTQPAAETLLELAERSHALHQMAESLASERRPGVSSTSLRATLRDAYRQVRPHLEVLYGDEAEAKLEELPRAQLPKILEALHLARQQPDLEEQRASALADLIHDLEVVQNLRRDLARALEREKRHEAEEARERGEPGDERDEVTRARWQLDAGYEGLEKDLAPAYAEERFRRDLYQVGPQHLQRYLVADGTGEGPAPEARASALEEARPGVREVGARRRELFQQLSRERRRAWEAQGGEDGDLPEEKNPGPVTLARWRLDRSLEVLEEELRPLWAFEHQEEALRGVRRLPAERLRKTLEADPEHLGPVALSDPQALLHEAQPALQELAAREREVRVVVDRAERLAWEEQRAKDPETPNPDPETAARFRRDRLWSGLEQALEPLWGPEEAEMALSRLRGLPPGQALSRLQENPSLLGSPTVDEAQGYRLVVGQEALFHRLAAADRNVYQVRDRENRLQWEHDREAGRPTAAPDPVTTARWALDRELHSLEGSLRPLWHPDHQDEALARLRALSPTRAAQVLREDPAQFGRLVRSREETARKVRDHQDAFESLAQRQRELFQVLDRQDRLTWERERDRGERVAQPDPVTAARWRLDRAWAETERELRSLWVKEEQEAALQRLRGLEARKAHQELLRDASQFATLADSGERARQNARDYVEAHQAHFDDLAQKRSELLAEQNRQARLEWEREREHESSRPAAHPDPVTDARFRLDRSWERVEHELQDGWQAEHQQEALACLRATPPREAQEVLTREPHRFGPLARSPEDIAQTTENQRETFQEIETRRRELFQAVDRQQRLQWEASRDRGLSPTQPDPATEARWAVDRQTHLLERELSQIWTDGSRDEALRQFRALSPREAYDVAHTYPDRLGELAVSRDQAAALAEAQRAHFDHLAALRREMLLLADRRDRQAWEKQQAHRRNPPRPSPVRQLRWEVDRTYERLEAKLRETYRPEHHEAAIHQARRSTPERFQEILDHRPKDLGTYASRWYARGHLEEARKLTREILHLRREALEAATREARVTWEKARAEGRQVPDPDRVTAARWNLDRAHERLEHLVERIYVPKDVQPALQELRRRPPEWGREVLEQRSHLLGERRPRGEIALPRKEAVRVMDELIHLRRELFRTADREARKAWEAARVEGRKVAEPDPLTQLRWQVDHHRERLEGQLRQAFGPERAPQVQRSLDRLHPREAAAVLERRPERLAPLPGRGRKPFRSPERKAAHEVLSQASATLRELAGAQRTLAQNLAAATELRRLGREITTRALNLQISRMPQREQSQQRVAQLALRMGYRTAAMVLPRPAVNVVSMAVRAVQALEGLERGRGMELGR